MANCFDFHEDLRFLYQEPILLARNFFDIPIIIFKCQILLLNWGMWIVFVFFFGYELFYNFNWRALLLIVFWIIVRVDTDNLWAVCFVVTKYSTSLPCPFSIYLDTKSLEIELFGRQLDSTGVSYEIMSKQFISHAIIRNV